MFDEARAFEDQGLLDRAIEEYGRLAEQGKGGAEALVRKGLLHRQLGDVFEATRSLERARAIAPDDPYPLMRLGQLAEDLGQPIAAAGHMLAAVDVATPSGGQRLQEMQVNLVAAYTRLQWLDAGRRVASALPEGLPDWWAGAREKALSEAGEARASALKLLRARRTDGLSSDAWLELARRLLALGRLKSARRVCQALMRHHPDWLLLRYFLADVIAREAGPGFALAALRETPELPRDTTEYMGSEIRLLQELGRWAEILDRLAETRGVARFPHVHHAGVMAMLLLGRVDQLAPYCLNWMAEEPLALAPAASIVFLHARGAERPQERPSPSLQPVKVMQFWHSRVVPQDVRGAMESWPALNPGWVHSLFNADGARDFFSTYLGAEAVKALDACFHPAMMADIFRLGFLHVEGGVYVDADEVCLRAVDALLPDLATAEIVAPLAGSFPGYVDNFFIAARQGSEVMSSVLQDAIVNILSSVREGRRPDIWQVTGPGALTRGVARHLGAVRQGTAGVFLLPMQQYRGHVRTQGELAYKRDEASNWRIAELD